MKVIDGEFKNHTKNNFLRKKKELEVALQQIN